MTVGIGTDIVQVERIQGVLDRQGRKFAERILSEHELEIFDSRKQQAHYLAKRFAAKEAAGKALGTGIGEISWQDMEVTNNKAGAPQLHFKADASARMNALGAKKAFLSLSDEREYVLAFVVLS